MDARDNSSLEWLESNGGPLLLLSEDLLESWHGADGPMSGATDYERACATRQPLERIRVGSGFGLVLGDEPISTAWMPDASGSGGVLVRLSSAADQAVAERAVRQGAKGGLPRGSSMVMPVRSALVLFDAAHSGTDLPPKALRIELAPGEYEVDTLSLQPDPDTTLLLHRLAPR
ncbi:MAG TPA: Imm21 family immunity protein [Gemmatimonadaceae bacterium]|nr:Imm21 family immunity protein [Gemmatimonadaceae bacterium]